MKKFLSKYSAVICIALIMIVVNLIGNLLPLPILAGAAILLVLVLLLGLIVGGYRKSK